VGKVTLKSNAKKALSDGCFQKSNARKALNNDFNKKIMMKKL
jgi:hypothetical protein